MKIMKYTTRDNMETNYKIALTWYFKQLYDTNLTDNIREEYEKIVQHLIYHKGAEFPWLGKHYTRRWEKYTGWREGSKSRSRQANRF